MIYMHEQRRKEAEQNAQVVEVKQEVKPQEDKPKRKSKKEK